MQNGNTAAALDFDQLRNVTMGDGALMREIMSSLIDEIPLQIEKIRMRRNRRTPQWQTSATQMISLFSGAFICRTYSLLNLTRNVIRFS